MGLKQALLKLAHRRPELVPEIRALLKKARVIEDGGLRPRGMKFEPPKFFYYRFRDTEKIIMLERQLVTEEDHREWQNKYKQPSAPYPEQLITWEDRQGDSGSSWQPWGAAFGTPITAARAEATLRAWRMERLGIGRKNRNR